MAGWAAVKIDVQGWGMEDEPNEGWIKINGQTLVKTKEAERPIKDRGIYMVCLQQQDNGYVMVDGIQLFDTHGHNSEAEEMKQFLASQPDGSIVVAASCDDFTSELKREARKVLQDIGAKLNFQYRSSFALVTIKGDAKRAIFEERLPGKGPSRVQITL